MFKEIMAWLMDCSTDDEVQRLIDAAYCEGARREREAILGILDRLIPEFIQVNNSVARQARAEIFGRCGHESKNTD
jgi:hypothetical protein